MFGKTSKPMIKTIIGAITQRIESKNQSPRARKDFDLDGSVGLGLVAALGNPRDGPAKSPTNKALFSRNLSRSKPIPSRVGEEMDMNSRFEEYTLGTCHGPEGSCTTVYPSSVIKSHDVQTSIKVVKSKRSACVFHISPEKTFDLSGIRSSDDGFLRSCNMCLKELHGKDIYIYSGEKAFCSSECRYKQMVIDEGKEKYYISKASRRHISSASAEANTEQIFTTVGNGILASS